MGGKAGFPDYLLNGKTAIFNNGNTKESDFLAGIGNDSNKIYVNMTGQNGKSALIEFASKNGGELPLEVGSYSGVVNHSYQKNPNNAGMFISYGTPSENLPCTKYIEAIFKISKIAYSLREGKKELTELRATLGFRCETTIYGSAPTHPTILGSINYISKEIPKFSDQDGDGVPDDKDKCSNTPPNVVINVIGCSPDQESLRVCTSQTTERVCNLARPSGKPNAREPRYCKWNRNTKSCSRN